MQYPIIKYSVIRSRLQTKNDCAIFAMCRYFEQLARLQGYDIHIDPVELESHFIAAGIKKDDEGTPMATALSFLRTNKINIGGFRVKRWGYLPKCLKSLRLTLARTTFMFAIKTWTSSSKRIKRGYMENKHTRTSPGRHAVLSLGWDGEGIRTQDSNYDYQYTIRPDKFFEDLRAIYNVTLIRC